MTIRCLELNMHGGVNNAGQLVLGEQAAFIRKLAPDIVMLQEVHHVVRRSNHVDQAEQLSVQTGLRHYVYGEESPLDDGWSGNAILSAYPLTDAENVIVPKPWYLDTNPMGIVGASALIGGYPYRLFSTHFNSRYDEYRKVHGKFLANLIHGLPPPVSAILGGDFNADAADTNLDPLRQWMTEAYLILHPDKVNVPSIDQIWVGNTVQHNVGSYEEVPALHVTDHPHCAILATLIRVPAPPRPARISSRPSPYPLQLPAGSGNGRTHTRVTATDVATGRPVVGSVTVDGTKTGGVKVTAPIGQSVEVSFLRKRIVDPRTHDAEIIVTLPPGVVSAPGYPDTAVDWGL